MSDEIDYDALNKAMDRIKSKVFLEKNAAFYGSLLSSLEFVWSTEIPQAGVDGVTLWWNPTFFLKTEPAASKTVLIHELEHCARLHFARCGSRDPEVWNYACDIRINNGLENDNYSFEGIEHCWKDHSFDMNGLMAEEDIYDILIKDEKNKKPKNNAWGGGNGQGDLVKQTKSTITAAINNVVRAIQQAKISGCASSIPGGIEDLIDKFLEPVVNWEAELLEFATDLLHEDYTWARPNRRHSDIYLPSRFTDDGRLEHLVYFQDVSGSITQAQSLRFNSEVKYIQEVLQPSKLTLVQFDMEIVSERVFELDEPFDEIKIVRGGGTCLKCVREYIERVQPTAAVIFSDLYCTPMKKLTEDIPIIWAVINSGIAAPFGKTIHIKC